MFEDLDTPVLLIDDQIVQRNLQQMGARIESRGLSLRPHTKTHKSPEMARRQMALGASGIMVAKLGEAEVMANEGFTMQSIGYPLIGSIKEDRLVALLARGVQARVSVDSEEGLHLLHRAFQRTGIATEALIEVDTGLGRCGLLHPEDVIALADRVRHTEGIHYAGITCFGGHVASTPVKDEIVARIRAENERLSVLVRRLREAHLVPEVISEGGTIAAAFMEELTVANELRPGTYIYNDAATVAAHSATWDDCALTVLVTVVSKPAPNRIIIDGGSKTFSSDGPVAGGFGVVHGYPQYRVRRLSEEHGVLEESEPLPFEVGDRIRVIPNHACTTVNLHDVAYLYQQGQVIQTLPIQGRGKVQ